MIETENTNERTIVVTHVTIRQSIFFLVMKLIVIEVVAGIAVAIFHTIILSPNVRGNINPDLIVFNIPLFVAVAFAKIILTIFVIIQWVNEYYEITPKEVIHKKGLIFKKEERHTLNHLVTLEVEQGLVGRIFHYGTLKLFNKETKKDTYLYLIHNPMKYHRILQDIIPQADTGKQVFREHLLEEDRV